MSRSFRRWQGGLKSYENLGRTCLKLRRGECRTGQNERQLIGEEMMRDTSAHAVGSTAELMRVVRHTGVCAGVCAKPP